ncbi:MAG: hypothetical protein J6X60_04415, partial [Ruminiclostridium sp.]|nr:hypothetical protein [Ruminiclostridium sp.]
KDELDRFRISDLIVPADGRVLITLKNNNSSMALMHTQTNFSLKPGETLYFSDQDCNIISVVPVLALNIGQSLSAGVDGKYHIGPVTQLKDNIQR